ncbi:sensor domain-containing diguanylate cyclase [Aquabacterium sp.]|uniref:sensor domain-containing diguanylate cyclase n=1 Tax=Aquabacterium sp. TaxID=1872578 RepID=UPI002C3EFA4D|nr:sensor domain-containing diguanylate cyclase [Aquabacterium sp.]HSW05442.1 sensor domain-containing diguanylate cyclase [Aquabacterium sp.]
MNPAPLTLPAPDAADLTQMFALAPVSLWLEDFSGLARLFARWRAEGVHDLRAHLRADRARIHQCTRELKVLQVNRRTLELFGATSQDELLAGLDRVFRDDMLDHHVEELVQLWSGALAYGSSTVNYTLDGRRLDVALQVRVLPGHEATWDRVLLSLEDLSAREQARRALQRSERYAQGLFEHSPVSLWVEDFSGVKRLIDEVRAQGIVDFRVFTDVHPEFVERCMAEIRVIDVNKQTLTMFRAPDKATLLQRLPDIFRDEMKRPFTEQLIELWSGKLQQQRETVNYALDGEVLHVHLQFAVLPGHEEDWSLVQVSLTDITARRKAEAYLEFLGKHDALTKLRNRSYFDDELNRLERKSTCPVALLVIDVNGLKPVNDERGHRAGDALLRRVGEVLSKAVEPPATAARIGGDEFALLLPMADEHAADQIVAQIGALVALNNQFHSGDPLSLAIGVAVSLPGERLEAALHRADKLMYTQKKAYHATAEHDRRRD